MSDFLMADLPDGPFVRLATLLNGVEPAKPSITMAVGDPQGEVPPFIAEALAREAASFGRYPAANGTEGWPRAAKHLYQPPLRPARLLCPSRQTCVAAERQPRRPVPVAVSADAEDQG